MIHPSFLPYLSQVIHFLKEHKIANASLFGSVLTNHFNQKSDVDFLINFQPGLDPLEKGALWWNLHDKLRDAINREVDLVTETALKNPYLIEEINKSKVKIYG